MTNEARGRPVGGCSPKRVLVLQLLDDYPSGKFYRDVAVIIDSTPESASRMLKNLRAAGLVKAVTEAGGGSRTRARYYLPKHEAAAMAAHDAEKGKTWGFGRQGVKAPAELNPRAASTAFVDRRFAVDRPEPFFSRPGYSPSFIGHDTWAAKVYP